MKLSFMVVLSIHSFYMASGNVSNELQCQEISNSMKPAFCLPEDYDKDTPPSINNASLHVKLVITFDDIVNVNDDDCTVTFNIHFDMSWVEPRLNILLNASTWKDRDTPEMQTFVPIKYMDNIWKPDLDIHHLKKFEIRKVLKKQGEFGLYENKRLWYGCPVQITLNCPDFEFDHFPFDRQYCDFIIGSYQWTADSLLYKGIMTYDESKQRPLQYEINYIKALSAEKGLIEFANFDYLPNGTIEYYTESYSHFSIKMEFTRRIQSYIISTYLPSFLIVSSSWLGFLIGTTSIPGRLTVTVVLLLVLINMSVNLASTMPNITGVSAIGIWMLACIIMVFGALVEYGGILYLSTRKETNSNSTNRTEKSVGSRENKIEVEEVKRHQKNHEMNREIFVEKVDSVSLVMFPIIFFVFISVYTIFLCI